MYIKDLDDFERQLNHLANEVQVAKEKLRAIKAEDNTLESKLVDFRECVLTVHRDTDQPFYIGIKGYGPNSMGRVLIARPGYEWRIIPCNANQKVILKRVCK